MGYMNLEENLQKLELPSTKHLPEPEWVVMDVSPLIAADSVNVFPGMTLPQIKILMLTRRIKEWSYYQDKELTQKLPIDPNTVGHLKIEDLNYLADCVQDNDVAMTDEEKKTSSGSLSQSEKVSVNVL